MALLWLDSFDHYVTADLLEKYDAWNQTVGNVILPTGGRRSGGCFNIGYYSSYLVKSFASAPNPTICVGFALKIGGFPGGNVGLFDVRSASTQQVSLGLTNLGMLRVMRGSVTGTQLGIATIPLPVNAFVFIEMKVAIHPSAGTVTVRVNEFPVITLTGQNTSATGAAAWDNILLGNSENSGQSLGGNSHSYDDLYVLDGSGGAPANDFLGDVRVDARYPTAEGASSAWTPLSGTDNALMVDDPGAPDDDTTYNSTPTVGATDTHVTQDAPIPGGALLGVQVCLSLKKSDAGTCSVAPVVRHGSTDYPGTAVNPGTAYNYAVTPYGLNPGTGAAWTEADFNAAQFGYRRTA
jgi:hypothetical protein